MSFSDLLQVFSELIIFIIFICISSIWMGLVFGLTLFLIFRILKITIPMLNNINHKVSESLGKLINIFIEITAGKYILLLSGKSAFFSDHLKKKLADYNCKTIVSGWISAWQYFWCNFLLEFYTSGLIICVAYLLSTKAISSAFAGLLFTFIIQIPAIIGLALSRVGSIGGYSGNLKRLQEILDLNTTRGKEISQIDLTKDIVFKNFSMAYQPDAWPVLKNINCTISAGSTTAIIGRTGAGKSSMIYALMGLGYSIEGEILIGGNTISKLSPEELSLIKIISQEPVLFEGTVQENIDSYGTVTKEYLDDVLEKLPIGLSSDSLVTKFGSNISLGQKQLIAVARAMISYPKILIMDEPVGLQDKSLLENIIDIMRKQVPHLTIVVITHKELLSCYDFIIRIESGKVIHSAESNLDI
jgi:ABC-type multidrug transport system fused ATPase/permease subunit